MVLGCSGGEPASPPAAAGGGGGGAPSSAGAGGDSGGAPGGGGAGGASPSIAGESGSGGGGAGSSSGGTGGTLPAPSECDVIAACDGQSSCTVIVSQTCGSCSYGGFVCGTQSGVFTSDGLAYTCEPTACETQGQMVAQHCCPR
jgi:hypothetical protein